MKKWLFGVLLMVLSLSAKAQFEAGTKYVGASVSNLGLSYSTNEKFRFGANASVGYFLADQFLVKADLGYNHTEHVDDFTTGLNGRFYFKENGIFVGAGGEFVHYTKNNNDVMIPVELGYCFYLNHYVSIEPSVYYKMSLNDFSDKSTVGFKIGFGFYF
ncbi:MAG: outer membrane beta-barrel protein [Bacteroidaceae bacterium]|nr:outer membrane beta-barrel protein [Bacteroidaceae bacterium]